VAGSAQARRRGALLQHGSIPIRIDPDRLAGATGARASDLPVLKGLAQILGAEVPGDDLRRALRGGFEAEFGVSMVEADLSRAERERAEWLRAWRYLTQAWTFRR
jgi:lipoate-protein ligase A